MEKIAQDRINVKIARIHAGIMAVVIGLLCGIGLFVLTAWLVIKGGPNPGPHLQLLAQYFPGYSVTWPGAVIGLFYGSLFGGIWGWFIGLIYNRVAATRNSRSDE